MKFYPKTALKYIILFLIGVAVLYLAFRGQNLSGIWLEIKTANYSWVFASVLVVWLAHVLRALRWQMLYRSIKYKVSFWNVYHAVMVGYLANLALPRFGEIGRCSVIRQTEKVPMFASIGTVITERLFDILMLFVSAFAMLIFQYDKVSNFLYDTIYLTVTKKLVSLNYVWLGLAGAALFILVAAAVYLLRKRFNRKFLRIFVGLRQGFGSYKKLKNKGLFLTYTVAIWLFYMLSMYLCFYSMQATTTLGVSAAFTALVFSGFAMAAPVQGGIGVFHWMVAQSLVRYAVSFNDGLAYATLIHSSQVLLILILGCFSLFSVLTKKTSR